MRKALLCIGNPLRGDDDVGNETGRIVEANLKDWRVFYGQDVPENEFAALREFAPEILIVVDAMSGFDEDKIEFSTSAMIATTYTRRITCLRRCF